MIVGVPGEIDKEDKRVALIPSSCRNIIAAGLDVVIEKNAGINAGYSDQEYEAMGVTVEKDREAIFQKSNVIIRINFIYRSDPGDQIKLLSPGQVLIGFFRPYSNKSLINEIAKKNIISFALELIPRITRAQTMDAVTSMSTIAGYKAAVIACESINKVFPLWITASGTITPAKVFVIGAGVAGLQAIATSRKLGAVVTAYDVRPEVREQIKSVGGRNLDIEMDSSVSETAEGYAKDLGKEFYDKQQMMMERTIGESDVVISTASVFGKRAPVLITKKMVELMKPGSVIVDLAAESGGNCELTEADKTICHNRVKIIGNTNVPSTVAYNSSQMFSNNISSFLLNIVKDGKLSIDLSDRIVKDTMLTNRGEIVNDMIRKDHNSG